MSYPASLCSREDPSQQRRHTRLLRLVQGNCRLQRPLVLWGALRFRPNFQDLSSGSHVVRRLCLILCWTVQNNFQCRCNPVVSNIWSLLQRKIRTTASCTCLLIVLDSFAWCSNKRCTRIKWQSMRLARVWDTSAFSSQATFGHSKYNWSRTLLLNNECCRCVLN
jgi:hypothetical protein